MSFNEGKENLDALKEICGRSSLLISQTLPQHAHQKFDDFIHVDVKYRVAHLVADLEPGLG